jgi:hypothetical protein
MVPFQKPFCGTSLPAPRIYRECFFPSRDTRYWPTPYVQSARWVARKKPPRRGCGVGPGRTPDASVCAASGWREPLAGFGDPVAGVQDFVRGIAESSSSSASRPQKRLPTSRWSAVASGSERRLPRARRRHGATRPN